MFRAFSRFPELYLICWLFHCLSDCLYKTVLIRLFDAKTWTSTILELTAWWKHERCWNIVQAIVELFLWYFYWCYSQIILGLMYSLCFTKIFKMRSKGNIDLTISMTDNFMLTVINSADLILVWLRNLEVNQFCRLLLILYSILNFSSAKFNFNCYNFDTWFIVTSSMVTTWCMHIIRFHSSVLLLMIIC